MVDFTQCINNCCTSDFDISTTSLCFLLFIKDFLAPICTVIAICIAVWAAKLVKKYTSQQVHTKYLLDIDLKLIDNPELWTIYDDAHLKNIYNKENPCHKSKLEAFVYYHFNLFNMIYEHYNFPKSYKKLDDVQKSWYNYIKDFFEKSSFAREIFNRDIARNEDMFGKAFTEMVKTIISDIGKNNINPVA